MKKALILLLVILSNNLMSQSLVVFDVDTSNFPVMKAKFFAFDVDGRQIVNINSSDFLIAENGAQRKVLGVSCPELKPLLNISAAMSIDVSGSMADDGSKVPVDLGKTTAADLCQLVAMPPSEFALQICNDHAVILQDFTTDRNAVLSKIKTVTAGGNNDFTEQLLNDNTGLFNIAKSGKYKRIAILYTDALWTSMNNYDIQRCINICSDNNIQFFAILYSNPLTNPFGIKYSLKVIAQETGGMVYDGITNVKEAKELACILQAESQGGDPCSIEWESGVTCNAKRTDVVVQLTSNGTKAEVSYLPPDESIAGLVFKPPTAKFIKAVKDTCTTVTVTARNADFNIASITPSNPAYRIEPPTGFLLKNGESRNLTVCYTPADSGYTYCKFTVESDLCSVQYYANGGFPGKRPSVQTLKLIKPDGGEVFLAGTDTAIVWEGVLPDEPVKIEYSTDEGASWITIADSTDGLMYNWHVPRTPGNRCLARVTAAPEYMQYEYPVVKICDQLWMGCNLNERCYRNGDSVLFANTPEEWTNACNNNEGACCYYYNDASTGKIYGLLYNWFALNDSRGLAPDGWHIATDAEWTELTDCLGGNETCAGQLKTTGTVEAGTGLWKTPNLGATNERGFSALPGGYVNISGVFYSLNNSAFFWTSTDEGYQSTISWCRILNSKNIIVERSRAVKTFGFSVRCVVD